jgi:3-hydroxyanthranilate 3,4-dioxygenase
LVIETTRKPEQVESLLWFCDRCDAVLHEVTMHVADIERELTVAIEGFDGSVALRTCGGCGYLHPERSPVPEKP